MGLNQKEHTTEYIMSLPATMKALLTCCGNHVINHDSDFLFMSISLNMIVAYI